MSEARAAPPLSRITALLTRGPGAPRGNVRHGLELVAALGPDGHIGEEAYYADPRPWPVRRFRPGRTDWAGELVREADSWALRGTPEADGPLWFLDARGLRPGEYLTLRRPDGEELSFRVVNVTGAEI